MAEKFADRRNPAFVVLTLFIAAFGFLGAGPAGAQQGLAGLNIRVVPSGRNYIHVVSDLEQTLRFYENLLEQPVNGSGPGDFSRNAPVEQMYNANGGEFRGATMPSGVKDLTLEFLEWRGLPSTPAAVNARVYAPGAVVLMLFVKDMDQAVRVITSNGGSIVTASGPVVLRQGRIALASDPDGYFIQLVELNRNPGDTNPTNILTGRLRLAVTDAVASAAFYREAFGFDVPTVGAFRDDETQGTVNNMGVATERFVLGQVPDSALVFELGEYQVPGSQPVQQVFPAVGTSMLRLQVADFDAALTKALDAGAVPAPNNDEPVVFPNGRRMTVLEDPDGFLLQLVEAFAP